MGDSKENKKKHVYIETMKDLEPCGWSDLKLRPYQITGVNWMIDRYYHGDGCILGDEMGLGKTCQLIAVMAYIHSNTSKATGNQPSLVISPLSVLRNWQDEVKRFAPDLKTLAYVGDKEKREEMAQRIKADRAKGKLNFQVLITTYETCLKDASFLQRFHWHLLVFDEAHRLKNVDSLLHKTLVGWKFEKRYLLTGTPVQNNLKELHALLSFISSRKFDPNDAEDFVEKYSDMDDSDASELHKLLQPLLLRRTKKVVLKDLPQKSEVILTHGISKLQAKMYKAILMKDVEAFESVYGYSGPKQQTSLMNILMQLRKCVNHPYLFDGVEPEPFVLGDHLIEASGKLVLIDKLLDCLKVSGHKVLLFSQMTHMLDILQDYLGYKGYLYERLDGSVRGEERFLAVQKFNENEETFVFLLSTKAGGQGINLTSADTVIFVDSDFNPQNDLQAAARAHRIGQTRPVKVIRLVGKNTVEEIILKRAEEKLKLTEKVIEEGQFSLGLSKQSMITDEKVKWPLNSFIKLTEKVIEEGQFDLGLSKQGMLIDEKVKLQDILMYGVDELLKDSDDVKTEVDFKKFLGPTVGGEWQPEEKEAEEEKEETPSHSLEDVPQSMYVFEGTDYSAEPSAADKKAFDDLIAAEKAVLEAKTAAMAGPGERPLRKRQTDLLGPLPDVLARKPRKKLSPEELEERRRKMKEKAEKRAKEAEEQEIRRAQELRTRRDEFWKSHKYESCNVEMESDSEESAEEREVDEEEDEGQTTSRDIKYVIGDVTHPQTTSRSNNIVVHCADDSGNWGRGGLFSAIVGRSPLPEEQYTLAGKMKDLALGDCHLIPIDDVTSRKEGNDWLGLIIAQHRDKRNHLSGIKTSALRYGLRRVYKIAKEKKASVHLPRIGHDTPAFNWYGTEKLIKKHLAAKGIPTLVYYFPRKQQMKRKQTVVNDQPTKLKKHSTTQTASTSQAISKELLNLFTDIKVVFHKEGISEEDKKKYRRYIIAYDGDVDNEISIGTTHIVLPNDCQRDVVTKYVDEYPEVKLVSAEWLDDCLMKKKCLPTENYELC